MLYLILPFIMFSAFSSDSLETHYLKSHIEEQIKKEIPTYPEKGTLKYKDDEKMLLDYQKSRLVQDCERAKASLNTLENLYGPPYGPLSLDEIKNFQVPHQKLLNEIESLVNKVKLHYKRPRPAEMMTQLKPCIQHGATTSYPSTQSIIGFTFEHILKIKFKNKSQKIHNRANQIANDRILSGAHYPSDIEASEKISTILWSELKKSKDFKKDFQI